MLGPLARPAPWFGGRRRPAAGLCAGSPSGILHVCICMYVKPAVCMMYVFTQKYIHIHAFATYLYFVCIVCMYVYVVVCV